MMSAKTNNLGGNSTTAPPHVGSIVTSSTHKSNTSSINTTAGVILGESTTVASDISDETVYIIIGVFLGVIFLILFIGVCIFIAYRRRQKRQSQQLLNKPPSKETIKRSNPDRVSYDRPFTNTQIQLDPSGGPTRLTSIKERNRNIDFIQTTENGNFSVHYTNENDEVDENGEASSTSKGDDKSKTKRKSPTKLPMRPPTTRNKSIMGKPIKADEVIFTVNNTVDPNFSHSISVDDDDTVHDYENDPGLADAVKLCKAKDRESNNESGSNKLQREPSQKAVTSQLNALFKRKDSQDTADSVHYTKDDDTIEMVKIQNAEENGSASNSPQVLRKPKPGTKPKKKDGEPNRLSQKILKLQLNRDRLLVSLKTKSPIFPTKSRKTTSPTSPTSPDRNKKNPIIKVNPRVLKNMGSVPEDETVDKISDYENVPDVKPPETLFNLQRSIKKQHKSEPSSPRTLADSSPSIDRKTHSPTSPDYVEPDEHPSQNIDLYDSSTYQNVAVAEKPRSDSNLSDTTPDVLSTYQNVSGLGKNCYLPDIVNNEITFDPDNQEYVLPERVSANTAAGSKYIDVLDDPAFATMENKGYEDNEPLSGYIDMQKSTKTSPLRGENQGDSLDDPEYPDYSYAETLGARALTIGAGKQFFGQEDYYNVDFDKAADILRKDKSKTS